MATGRRESMPPRPDEPGTARLSNRQIAQAFEELAEQLQFGGREFSYPARTYRRAAAVMRQLPVSVEQLARDGRLSQVRGFGRSTIAKVIELCDTGSIAQLERMRERTPKEFMLLTRAPGVGRAAAEQIWQQLRPRDLDDLREAADDGRLLGVRGIGPMRAEAVRRAIDRFDEEPELAAVQLLRSQAQRAAENVRMVLEPAVPGFLRFHVGGQLARGAELVDVVDVLLVAADASAATAAVRDELDSHGWHTAAEESLVDDECLTFALQAASGAGVRVHVADERREGHSLLFCVGPDEHAASVLAAAERGAEPGPPPATAAADSPDAALYEAAGLQYVPFELREREDILERARTGSLPALVELEDLQAELHCHSTWSDGRASTAEMARAAIERGYRYIAITDHSEALRIVNGLGAAALRAQWHELEEVRTELPEGFELLQGIELEIQPDGTLDLDPDTLSRLDWVVASLHTGQRQSSEEITARMETALRNPLVDCIGHPTSRLLLRRDKTLLDTDKLIELAAQTGTFLEINSSPERLDLDAPTARQAAEAGVLICINSDAHGPDTLRLVEHGIATARRAGLTREQVANARPWHELQALRKRWRA